MPITINRKSLANGGTINGSVTITQNITATGTGTSSVGGPLTVGADVNLPAGGYGLSYGVGSRQLEVLPGIINITTALKVASTSAIKGVRTATGTLTTKTISPATSDTWVITVTGAAVGDQVSFTRTDYGLLADGLVTTAYVSSANTVTIRAANCIGSNVTTDNGAPYRVTVTSF